MKVLDLFAGTGSSTKAFEDRGYDVIKVELDQRHDADLHLDVRELSSYPELHLESVVDDPRSFDIIWASPPCIAFSVAGKGSKAAWDRHEGGMEKPSDTSLEEFRWHYPGDHPFFGPRTPNDDTAKMGCELVLSALNVVRQLEPEWWWIENPMGGLRTMGFMQALIGMPPSLPQSFLQGRPDYVSEDLARWLWEVDASHTDVTYCQYWNPLTDVEESPRMKRTDLWGVWPESWNPRGVCGNGMPCHEAAPRGSKTGTQKLDKVDRSRVPYELSNEIARSCIMG